MFTNRLFNLIVSALVVMLAVWLTGFAGSPAVKPIDHSAASNYEDRYDRMNEVPDAGSLYKAGNYEGRYDRMNDFSDAGSLYKASNYEDRYDRMNKFP